MTVVPAEETWGTATGAAPSLGGQKPTGLGEHPVSGFCKYLLW